MHGILLLLGIAPRFQLVGILINLISFQNQNGYLWDCEDEMIRIWCFLLMFLPIHLSTTIYDGFEGLVSRRRRPKRARAAIGPQSSNRSWPMWPFRLWQVEVSMIYMATSSAKLARSTVWHNGQALYWVIYDKYFGGIFSPDILFNRIPALSIMSYAAIWIESTAWITIWIPKLRYFSFLEALALHLGIELSMTLHMFEWLAIMGWCTFLVQPSPEADLRHEDELLLHDTKEHKKKKMTEPSFRAFRRVGGTITFWTIIICFASCINPLGSYTRKITPRPMRPFVDILDRSLRKINSVLVVGNTFSTEILYVTGKILHDAILLHFEHVCSSNCKDL